MSSNPRQLRARRRDGCGLFSCARGIEKFFEKVVDTGDDKSILVGKKYRR